MLLVYYNMSLSPFQNSYITDLKRRHDTFHIQLNHIHYFYFSLFFFALLCKEFFFRLVHLVSACLPFFTSLLSSLPSLKVQIFSLFKISQHILDFLIFSHDLTWGNNVWIIYFVSLHLLSVHNVRRCYCFPHRKERLTAGWAQARNHEGVQTDRLVMSSVLPFCVTKPPELFCTNLLPFSGMSGRVLIAFTSANYNLKHRPQSMNQCHDFS